MSVDRFRITVNGGPTADCSIAIKRLLENRRLAQTQRRQRRYR
jgi:hypothetical protein